MADKLVDYYFQTIESVYRILHVPSFRSDYEALWVSDAKPDMAFLVQVKLVLAIGATTYDENFSLRASAVRWVYEAQTWISEPEFKSRLGIQFLQTNILLLIAREMTGICSDSIWVSAGELLRKAMSMGLHRDPVNLPNMTVFTAEMHRRLWNTTVEIALQSSLTSGGPPLVSSEDFDTRPPGNFDDEQLMIKDPVLKPEDSFTQVSISIALRKTFLLRLAVTKLLNGIRSHGTYEETLQLDLDLRSSYRTLCRTLQGYTSSTGSLPSRFSIRAVDVLMLCYLLSLHVPFFGPSLHEATYAFSRKIVVETSLKIWCVTYPASSIMSAQTRGVNAASPDKDELALLAVCSSGFYRTVAIQAATLIAIEIKAQLQEEEGLGPVPLRSDLLCVLDDAKSWCLQSIKAGETNIKGYVLMSIVAAQIEGLMHHLDRDELGKKIVKATEDAEDTCLPILEKMAFQNHVGGNIDELNQAPLSTPVGILEDWDFIVSEELSRFSL